jgi:hypothetical protein
MSDDYEGLATVVVIARYLGQMPIERTTFEFLVRLSVAEPGHTRIELQQYLHGPKAANLLRLTLPDGRMLQGQIIDGSNQPGGGWLLIHDGHFELTLVPSANRWQWE